MRNLSYERKIMVLFQGLLILTGIYDVVGRSGDKIGRVVLLMVTICAMDYFYPKTFLRKSKVTYVICLFFLFISMYLANIFNFYAITNYDKMLHFLSGVILGFIGLLFYVYMFKIKEKKDIDKWRFVIFLILFLVATAGIWEMWEYTTDNLFNLMAQNGLDDTMWDIILGTLGGIITIIPINLEMKKEKSKLIDEFLQI